MMSTTVLTLVDGTRVVAPDLLDLITPYVLREQNDWFEDEIKFLRRMLKPGQRVIDIGANYGVYTVSMAQAVGAAGKVWAFEPASSTAALLAEGILVNGFTHVTVEASAVSSVSGKGQLRLDKQSELNTLNRDAAPIGESETVPVVTLDERMEHYRWQDVAFVKMDAEGEEARILQGGKRFFSTLSPLVQYEIKAGDQLNMQLVKAFEALGYDSYRLVPGLDVLLPFATDQPPDAFLLNLFSCKPDRAAFLCDQDFLLRPASSFSGKWKQRLKAASARLAGRDSYDWRLTLGRLPYGRKLATTWEQTVASGNSAKVEEALRSYARARDGSLPTAERFCALESSFSAFVRLCRDQPTHLRLASLARVAREYGARSIAVSALVRLSDMIFQSRQADPSEPFLAPGERFDSVSPGEAIGDWVLSAVLEELERMAAFSSFYTGVSARERLEAIASLGFGSEEMQRRLSLVRQRFGLNPA